ncbi:hypothetical protein C8Q76DRAFT_631002 [Earliella scabrosa]|nr:hypothetical protein C8Q76DRAFT_631002 [Earliella scabrosa]
MRVSRSEISWVSGTHSRLLSSARTDSRVRRNRFRSAKDKRSWAERLERMDANWNKVLPRLVEAYLRWRYPPPPAADNLPPDNDPPATPPSMAGPPPPPPPPPPPEEQGPFIVQVFDIYTLASTATIRFEAALTHAEALVQSGYLGTVPDSPSLAISLKTLELMRSIKMVKSSFSIEAFTRLLCYHYSIPYHRSLRTALADVFDVYLMIIRTVDQRVRAALGRDLPNWRILYGCPACGYEVDGERPKCFSRLWCMDGNTSLKRARLARGRKIGDQRVFESDYFLTTEYVNRFANEVRARPQTTAKSGDKDKDTTEISDEEEDGDPTDGSPDIESTCTKNWKAAAADEKKRTWDIFEETGIFASACRHGFVLWIIDQIRSGELAKYPLATVSKALECMPPAWMCGFDVGCSFRGTASRSSLGTLLEQRQCEICVNAFHGYSHAFACQVRHHPNVIKGLGLEDFETMERIFSVSNHLASVIRYTTAYRRRVLIELHFRRWDEERYLALGKFLYENYIQALEIIDKQKRGVEETMRELELTPEDLDVLHAEQRKYVENVGKEDPRNTYVIAYVGALEELRDINAQLEGTQAAFLKNAPSLPLQFLQPHTGPTDYNAEFSKGRKLETNRRYLDQCRKVLMLEIAEMEVALGVEVTWQPSDPDYVAAQQYIATRKYQVALGNLQRLVVQRLFELHKMNLSQTGYKVRRAIAKSLQKRSRAIRNALKTYNGAAKALDPPRPPLDWQTISHYRFLQEFELLNDTRAELRDKRWADPLVRELMRRANRVARAEEEIDRVSDEAIRIHTSIRDEELVFAAVLEDMIRTRDQLYGAVADFVRRRQRANAHVLTSLNKLYRHPRYAGPTTPGLRPGGSLPAIRPHSGLSTLLQSSQRAEVTADDGNEDAGDEHEEEMFNALTDFIASMHV